MPDWETGLTPVHVSQSVESKNHKDTLKAQMGQTNPAAEGQGRTPPP